MPILLYIAMDVCTILVMLYVNFTHKNTLLFVSWCVILLVTCGGPTNRWSLSLPLVPFGVIQLARRAPLRPWIQLVMCVLGALLIAMAAGLCILFPAVQIPLPGGPYRVGVVEFHLPVDFSSTPAGDTCSSHSELPVKLFYPTTDAAGHYPYLNPQIADEYCRKTMQFGAPHALKQHGWMLHTWKLATIRAKQNATLLDEPSRLLPIVVFSHGLGGNADVYSYQTMELASQGYVVLVLTHQDRSAPVVALSNGTELHYDFDIVQLLFQNRADDYVEERRRRTDHRVQEFIAAVEAIHRMNKEDIPGLDFSLRGRLLKSETFFMGHSFGGATALTAAKRRPDLVTAIVAHEPAIDWMPDDARHSLLPPAFLHDFEHSWKGGTGGFEGLDNIEESASIHEKNMLILFSNEWRDKKWAASDTLEELYSRNRLGPNQGDSIAKTIPDISHNEFSDTCMLTPLWLARSTGITGKRNPVETAKEIHEITKTFLESVRNRTT